MKEKEEIVVSGISGRFPESDNVEEFWKNLINGVDMVTADAKRWPVGYLGLPERKGSLKADLTHFDANFFGIFPAQAERVDPQIRQLLEVTFEAILDAGVNPNSIRGSNVGVFVGASAHDTFEACRKHPDLASGYDITGSACCMLANRISFAFDFRGPSFCIDTFCSSSLMALHQGMAAIRAGECDAAIIAGVNLLLNPMTSLQIQQLGALAKDGKCKAFDASADGFVRAEAIVAVFLQKSDVARRNYCTLLHSKTNTDGFKIAGVACPAGPIQQKLMEEVYAESRIDPNDVFYVEPHGTGTAVGDPQEINAIANVFTTNRKNPLYIGSTKSNMGHAEPAAALCGLVKIVMSLRAGIIPANLHYVNPNPNIPSLLDGRIKVVTKNMKTAGKLIGLNSTGLGGSNIHVIIRANDKMDLATEMPEIPVIIPFSGRTEESVMYALRELGSSQHTTTCSIGLIHKIAEDTIPGHIFRGFTILDDKISNPEIDVIQITDTDYPPPLWFVFSGMGTLWCGMLEGLMEFEVFSESIHKSTEILKPFDLDLFDILWNGTQDSLDRNMGICFIAMGVALIKLLESLGLKPDGFLGHSAGELLCSYMDGCITQEEALICYYYKDVAVLKCNGGGMAAVGLTWDETHTRCPPGIYPACHNAVNSVTVSGPEKEIRQFITELKTEGIFAREVSTGGIAYHSPYLKDILPEFGQNLRSVAKNTKLRSSKWISTSIPEDEWEDPTSIKTGSAEYILNNCKSQVLFHGVLKYIPSDAVVLEISAHSLFVSTLKKSLPNTNQVLGLLRKGKGNNGSQFLTAIGKLYQFGLKPKMAALYKPVEFPVPAQTPMIGPLVKWDHSTTYSLPDYMFDGGSGVSGVEVSLSTESDEYVSGHVIDGRNLFPATGYLVLAWKKFACLNGQTWETFSVEFENVRLERAALVPKTGTLKLQIKLDVKTGEFEVAEFNQILVTGIIRTQIKFVNNGVNVDTLLNRESKFLPLNGEDFYKELRLQGYEYQGQFKGVKMADNEGKWARVSWEENWVAFLDNMMQMSILRKKSTGLYIPTRIHRISIDPVSLSNILENNPSLRTEGLFVTYLKESDSIVCHGVQITGLRMTRTQRKAMTQNPPILEQYQFIPYTNPTSAVLKENSIKYMTDLVVENTPCFKLQIQERVELLQDSISSSILTSIQAQPSRKAEIIVISNNSDDSGAKKLLADIGVKVSNTAKSSEPSYNFIVVNSCFDSQTQITSANALKEGGFLLYYSEDQAAVALSSIPPNFNVISEFCTSDFTLKLLRKQSTIILPQPVYISVDDADYDAWFHKLQAAMQDSAKDEDFPRIYLTSTNPSKSGLIGLVNCLRQEPGGHKIRCLLSSRPHDLDSAESRLDLDLVMNVFDSNGVAGSYRHFPLPTDSLRTKKTSSAFVNIQNVGDLSTLKFIEAPPPLSSEIDLNEFRAHCEVHYAALNFRDVMLATGRLAQDSLPGKLATADCVLGLEFSGLDENKNPIMGMVEGCGMGTHVFAEKLFTWSIPSHWSLEEAATVPVAYSTAYYALIVRGRMRTGETVLIHSGSGGVGQAAIAIALSMQCKVYTTVGSEEKRQFLKDRFKQLKEESFSNSRDTSFEEHIFYHTEGRGVDLVLNSLAEEKLQASLRCLTEGGRFLEIGKFDLSRNNALGMEIFLKNITFHGILLDSLFGKDSEEKREVVQLLQNGLTNGTVKPLTRVVFDNTQVEDAFRFMASGKHIGKVLLKIRGNGEANDDGLISASARTYFDPTKVYIIIGGLGGFGLELSGWMIHRGAKNIILVSRSNVKNGYQALQIRRWQESGVQVLVSQIDASSIAGATELVELAKRSGAVGGIFNLAMVLRDGEISNQNVENFKAVVKPKIQTMECLDTASRQLCPDLDHFVVFSSAACGRGNGGQTNYGFANSGMERICESRKADNLPALAIQWGAIGDVGIVHDLLGSNDVILGGTQPQRISSCLEALDLFMRNQDLTVVSSMVLPSDSGVKVDKPSLLSSVARILGFKSEGQVKNREATLADLGVDSLTVVELKQLLDRSCGRDNLFSSSEIRELTWAKLEEMEN